ncbi:hypothetical protein [Pallidibacillus thermolactis]|uniref:hypothetical protein n=1 Tax=Pallidibacillus thermolactis TaxID=251051 RepID=UPI0021D87D90|nr:hypothetical protein [Pallidibacillus thermolactis subsp. kokeshiiformis]MCU9602651.1 hypothetical protein [Pallidibacillus thermolactis subsp. kokeshiiformis]
MGQLALEKGTSKEANILGWLMCHPAMIQPVNCTTNPYRIKKCQVAIRQADLTTREEWYVLNFSPFENKLP